MEKEFHIRFDLTVHAENEDSAYEVVDQLRDIPYTIPSVSRINAFEVSSEALSNRGLYPFQMIERNLRESTGKLAFKEKIHSIYKEVDRVLIGNGHTLTGEERMKVINLFRFSFAASEERLSQRDFAKDFGVNEQTVSRWSRGTTIPTRRQFDKLATYFGWNNEPK